MFVGVGASVSGDTPVLVRHQGRTRLVPIGEFVDGFYEREAAGTPIRVEGLQTLGFDELDSKFKGSSKTFVKRSAWKGVRAVYRHRVQEIYEIHYLGGMIRTTGDHSVFVRTRDGIKSIEARQLRAGDVLVKLPLKIRGGYSKTFGTRHTSRAHAFESSPSLAPVQVLGNEVEYAHGRYAQALDSTEHASQAAVGAALGVSQMTVSNWRRGVHVPRELANAPTSLPLEIEVTPGLLKLLGYYTAEGRENGCLEFTFGSHESDLHQDVISLMRETFGV
ncbi:MAG: hypothetical protein ACRENS_10495 [Candidatus Eiseniibacteriota bacterium]